MDTEIKPQILLTNDDGIDSPGLWAAAQVLSKHGFVNVVAPRDQQSGAGRSLPVQSDGIIHTQEMNVDGQRWKVYAVGGTPAQAVLHAVLEILPRRPDLVVSGINYGQNVGSGVTISGTVGAALEAASHGIPGLAISLETPDEYHLSHSKEVNFGPAAYFTELFGTRLLEAKMPQDVDVLKVEVPWDASEETPWRMTRVARERFYESFAPQRESWTRPGQIKYRQVVPPEDYPEDSDVYTLCVKRQVAVSPLSLDLTSRTNLEGLNRLLRR